MKGNTKCKNWGGLVVMVHPRSLDRVYMTSYLTSIQTTVCIYLVLFFSHSELFVKTSKVSDFNLLYLHLVLPFGVTVFEFH